MFVQFSFGDRQGSAVAMLPWGNAPQVILMRAKQAEMIIATQNDNSLTLE